MTTLLFRKLFLYCLIFSLCAAKAQAAIEFSFTTGDAVNLTQTLASDSNKCPTNGPLAAYVGGIVSNTGTVTETGIEASFTGLTGSFVLTGSQSPTIAVGSLAAGDSIMVAWHVDFPCDTSKKSGTPPSTNPTITITDDTLNTSSATLTLTSRNAISANAGGNVASTTLGAGAIIGQTITADIIYDFGGNAVDDEFFVQPAGNTDFDASCLRLIGSEVTSSNVTAAPVGTLDTLYFTSPTSQSGNNYFIGVRYFFTYLCADTTSTARPYAVQTSGNTNIKYTGNYDGAAALTFDFPVSSNPFILSKTASETALIEGGGPHVVTYTVALENPSSFDSVIDVFSDSLPTGASFVAIDSNSDVTPANSGSVPSNGDTGTLTFSGLTGSSYAIAGGSTLNLIYSVNIPDSVGDYVNAASASVAGSVLDSASATVNVGVAEISATKSVSLYDPDGLGGYMIPGSDVVYTFTLENTGNFPIDADSIVLIDKLPETVTFFGGNFDPAITDMGPLLVDLGTSGLTCCANVGEVDYSNTTSGPAVYGYTPTTSYDADTTYLKLTPGGEFEPNTTVTISFRARIK